MATCTSSELDIDTVKERTGITDKQLDSRIKEDNLWELAGHLGNYELFIGNPGFRLNEADKADLKDCALRNGHQLAMVEALKKWSNVTSSFTYRSLVEILIKLRNVTVAETVCEIAKRLIPLPRKMGPWKTVVSMIKRKSGQVRSDRGIDVEIKKFEKSFINLRKATLKELKHRKVSVSDLRESLIILPSSLSGANEQFVLSKLSLFEKAESVETIFAHLSFYLSFIDFDLLEHIIEQFGSERLKEDMSCYAQDMTEFKARTTISEALKYLPKPALCEQANPPKDFIVFISKFDIDVNVATLEKLDEYGKVYAKELSLSRLAFFLCEFGEGSLLVTWLVPTSLEMALCKIIMQQKSSSFFLSNNILELSLGGKQLYPLKKEVGQSSVRELTVYPVTAKPYHSSEYSDPDPYRKRADKMITLMESTPDCRGLVIKIPLYYDERFDSNMFTFLSSTCRFAVCNTRPSPSLILGWSYSSSLRSTMESVRLVGLKHCPIMVVARGRELDYHHCMLTDHGRIHIKDDIMEPLFSPATPHLADTPKIFLYITPFGRMDPSSIQTMIPSSGVNYIVGVISCPDVDSAKPTILRALESPQESVQEIFKLLKSQLPDGRMTVIDHLNEPVYLHPDAPKGTHSEPEPTKKLPSEQLEELVTSSVKKLTIDEATDLTLTKGHTLMVFEVLRKVQNDWYLIGLGIGCARAELEEIEARHFHDQRMCLFMMFQHRIRQGGLTRSMLCESLRGEFVGRDDLAKEIEALDLNRASQLTGASD